MASTSPDAMEFIEDDVDVDSDEESEDDMEMEMDEGAEEVREDEVERLLGVDCTENLLTRLEKVESFASRTRRPEVLVQLVLDAHGQMDRIVSADGGTRSSLRRMAEELDGFLFPQEDGDRAYSHEDETTAFHRTSARYEVVFDRAKKSLTIEALADHPSISAMNVRQRVREIQAKVVGALRSRCAFTSFLGGISIGMDDQNQEHVELAPGPRGAAGHGLDGGAPLAAEFEKGDSELSKLVQLVLMKLNQDNLRRLYRPNREADLDGGILLRQVYTSTSEDVLEYRSGHNTHYWAGFEAAPFRREDDQGSSTIASYVWETCGRAMPDVQQSRLVMNKGKNIVTSAAQLVDCWRGSFPAEVEEVRRDRQTWSFRNGIYSRGVFYAYGSEEYQGLSPALCSSRYFSDVDCVPGDGDALPPTPIFDSIMEYQTWDSNIQFLMKAMIGRLMFGLNDKDGWQVVPFLQGVAGCGKSTIIDKLIKEFYAAEDVGVMTNNIETQFGLSQLAMKTIVIAPEIRENFSLTAAEFQSLVSGEAMSMAVKNKNALVMTWNAPLVMAGNELPFQGEDRSGSIMRRLVPFIFSKKVPEGQVDNDLGKKLRSEIGAIIPACFMAYTQLWLQLSVGDTTRDVKSLFGEGQRFAQINRWKTEIQRNINSAEAFSNDPACIVRSEGHWCLSKDVENAYSAYCEKHGIRKTPGPALKESLGKDGMVQMTFRELRGRHADVASLSEAYRPSPESEHVVFPGVAAIRNTLVYVNVAWPADD